MYVMNLFPRIHQESILIKISSKNIDRKNFIFLRGSKQVQIKINAIIW